MTCKHPEKCEAAASERFRRMEPLLTKMTNDLDEFREAYLEGGAELAFDDHAEFRELWRAVSQKHVLEVFLNGELIECHKHKKECGYLISYYIKTGVGQYRPIHVRAVMPKNNTKHMTIVTVYDPRSKSYKWNKDFDRRICICK